MDSVNWNGFNERFRPIYSDGELHSGFMVLIDDTEIMYVYDMGDFVLNQDTKEWTGSFYFQTFDHFGLDDEDLDGNQHLLFSGEGFASWWLLQHQRGYTPFETELRYVFKIKGNLNN